MSHKTIRENDELTCTCGLRWGVAEDDPHTECYQCGERVNYLFQDSRCIKCTRITPDELRGSE